MFARFICLWYNGFGIKTKEFFDYVLCREHSGSDQGAESERT